MDPLDPLTEIIRTGQAISPFILIERLIWLLIGAFFLGALSTGIKNGMREEGWFGNKSFLIGITKKKAEKDKSIENNIKKD